MNKKTAKKSVNKSHNEEIQTPPPYTEGYWEGEFEYWENYQPSSNMGKWWITIQLEKIKNKLKRFQ